MDGNFREDGWDSVHLINLKDFEELLRTCYIDRESTIAMIKSTRTESVMNAR